jgi:hypothetical protein
MNKHWERQGIPIPTNSAISALNFLGAWPNGLVPILLDTNKTSEPFLEG